VLVAIDFDREGVGERARGVFAGRRHARIVNRGDLHSHRRIVRDDAPTAVFPVQLLFFRGAENADRLLHALLVQKLIGRGRIRAARRGRSGSARRRPGGRDPARRETSSAGTCSDEISSVSVRSGERLDTTIGAVIVDPSRSRTPVTAPWSTRICSTLVRNRISPPWEMNSSRRCSVESADPALELGHHRGAAVGHRECERQAGGAAGGYMGRGRWN